ncbi:molybdopterin molybdotransferase MoeA [Deferribacter autotrophicus]|uniref:Molybdopterin molybdenumtransferase n=1 Tax=Deferribacter autotrophicus TaxID=500465 RepID=A0A5A8F796_9BACT|nr:gephyrin-like molybdotransferase Glp [Deferribacter autotrophicus]KAA0259204.1 molybdopterin molybdotransferase MoeA [Deferribacter autotrophicus]
MINPFDALDLILSNVEEVGYEVIPVFDAMNRVAYENVKSKVNLPGFDNSAMDGFAFKYEDLEKCNGKFQIQGTISAGDFNDYKIENDCECYRIMTGAKVPEGADTVVEFEKVDEKDGFIILQDEIKRGKNVRKIGEDIKVGDEIDIKGKFLKSWDISRLISCGIFNVKVYRRLKVAVVATGDELLVPGEIPNSEKIYDANSYNIKLLLQNYGIDASYFGVAKDDSDEFLKLFDQFKDYDAVISSAGISFGDFDVVTNAFEKRGTKWLFKNVKQKPGKPFSFALIDGKIPFFALPGNPVSAFFCTFFYVLPVLRKMLGFKKYTNSFVYAKLMGNMTKKNKRFHFNRVSVKLNDGEFLAFPFRTQDSHVISSIFFGNAFAVIEDERVGEIPAGERLKCYLYDHESIF